MSCGSLPTGAIEKRDSSSTPLRRSERVRQRTNFTDILNMENENLRQLLHIRAGYASEFTKKSEEFCDIVKLGILSETKSALIALNAIYSKYNEAHQRYISMASTLDPASAEHYETQFMKVDETMEKAQVNYDKLRNEKEDEIQATVTPHDSQSQIGSNSCVSRVSSALAKAAAKRASLEAKARILTEKQQVEMKMQQEKQKLDQLDLEAEIQAAAAEEETLAKFVDGSIGNRSSLLKAAKKQSETTHIQRASSRASHSLAREHAGLDPLAPEWPVPQRVKNETSNPDEALFSFEHMLKFAEFVGNKGKQARYVEEHENRHIDNQDWGQLGEETVRDRHLRSRPTQQMPDETPNSFNAEPVAQHLVMNAIKLPKTTLMTFDGDPLQFWLFMKSFDNSVHNVNVSDSDKLTRLFEYCKGKAAKVIQPYALMEPSEGYKNAREMLKKRFGNSYTIARTWIKKITAGVPIKPNNGEALQEFTDEVRGCMATLQAMDMLNEVDSQDRMRMVLGRLPLYLQSRWRKEAYESLEKYGRYPGFKQFVAFLERASGEMNDPVFGVLEPVTKGLKERGSSKTMNMGNSFNLSATNPKPGATRQREWTKDCECLLCKENHRLQECKRFKEMDSANRLEYVRKKRLCYNCIEFDNHIARKCRKPKGCKEECEIRHSYLLHDALMNSRKPSTDSQVSLCDAALSQDTEVTSCACESKETDSTNVVLPIVSVNVRGKGQCSFIRTYALLDPGSNRTFCSQTLLNQLKLEGENTTLSVETISDVKNTDVSEVCLEVAPTGGRGRKQRIVNLPKVYALDRFPAMKSGTGAASDIKKWPHLRDIDIGVPNGYDTKVMLLIGLDVPSALRPLEVRYGRDDEPYAVRTVLGWTVNGPLGGINAHRNCISNFLQADTGSNATLDAQVEQFWKLDVGQCLAGSKPQMSMEDKRVLEVWNKSIIMQDGHYTLDIPFRGMTTLPNNRIMAEQRLHSLGKKLTRNPDLHLKYKSEIDALKANQYVERVYDEDASRNGRIWYLPHFCVMNPNKPEKLRIVFDCAAEFRGTSLNKQVLQGPDLTNRLVGVLLRFREHHIAIMGDIEAMFHQVKVSESHRDMLRFLWWKDGVIGQQPEVYRMTVHLFGGVWSPSCASFALQKTAESHKESFDKETCLTVFENFYVDDCLKSVPTVESAINLIKELCRLLSLGGFRLTKWVSNSKRVLDCVPVEERSKGFRSLDLNSACLPVDRALGVQWDTSEDTLGVNFHSKEHEYTRRGLLRIISSVYDPLGFVSPFVLLAKKIFQDECRTGKSWDDCLDPENQRKWTRWLADLPVLLNFKVSRCLVPKGFGDCMDIQLHHFCDASQDAYGTASYIRMTSSRGDVQCSLVLGKSRLAPMKPMTIPRLELSAAVLAVRVDCLLKQEFSWQISKSIFWTDSMIVLQYIKNQTKRFQTFVANRISIIHDGSQPEQWRHVDSVSNPSDDTSRGLWANEMLAKHRWVQGPEFLWCDESSWPSLAEDSPELLESDKEVKGAVKIYATTVPETTDCIEALLSRFSCWFRLRKAVAWLRRFLRWNKDREGTPKDSFSVEEIQQAETVIVQYIQKTCYAHEWQILKDSGGPVKKESPLYRLEPFEGPDGLLRVHGRLGNAPLPDSVKHPIILPRDHHVTKIIVKHVHEWQLRHSGREHVLASLREKYWVPRAGALVKRMLRECISCRKIRGKAQVQKMANLPSDRVTPCVAPFTFTGVDCFGPFIVKRGRTREKRYGCLFTCLTMRAIHIEKLHTLDADSFINALIRFICRRGVPHKLRSDNGTNFVGGNKELQECVETWSKTHQIQEALLLRQIEWEFNPPAASHMGGAWERQIRSVRKILSHILRDQVTDDERLDTLFCEAESIINSRPLTPVSDDPDDLKALTPNDLLMVAEGFVAPSGSFVKDDVYRRRWRHVQYMTDLFWKRWSREYLHTIQLRSKWVHETQNIKAGDMVIVIDESMPRKDWPLGRILEVYPGKDGLVRSLKVQTAKNQYVRPISKICLLEGAITSN